MNDVDPNAQYSDDLDSIDASVFSGELLFTNINEFENYVDRWKRAIVEHRKLIPEELDEGQ